jgi:hypothetical protein
MAVRMAKISAVELKNCVKHGLWGSNNSLSKWQIKDMLILYADRKLAAVAEVTGEAFMDDLPVWGNGLFPYRIPVIFKYVLEPDNMIPFDSEIIGTLIDEWGLNYGWGIVAKRPMSEESSKKLIEKIAKKGGK